MKRGLLGGLVRPERTSQPVAGDCDYEEKTWEHSPVAAEQRMSASVKSEQAAGAFRKNFKDTA